MSYGLGCERPSGRLELSRRFWAAVLVCDCGWWKHARYGYPATAEETLRIRCHEDRISSR